MSSLGKILSTHRIHNEKSFLKVLEQIPFDFPLTHITKNNIYTLTDHYFDFTENRIYEEKVTFINAIIDIDNLWLTDSVEIVLTNCIFVKKLTIGKREPRLKNIYIDNCIFLEELNIHSIANLINLSIYNSNFKVLNVKGVRVSNSIFFSYNNFLLLSMREVEAGVFDAIKNDIRFYESVDNIFSRLHFSYTQVSIKSIRKLPMLKDYLFRMSKKTDTKIEKFYKKIRRYISTIGIFFDKRMNLFKMNSESASELANASEMYENEYAILQTLHFLKNNTTIAGNRNSFTTIRYSEALYGQKGFIRKAFTRITGGFLRPGRILLVGAIIFLAYSFVYMNQNMLFNVGNRPLDFVEALYFSGSTFLTIGFGDLVPVGETARLLTLSEGLLGLITTNAFLISLVKKYID